MDNYGIQGVALPLTPEHGRLKKLRGPAYIRQLIMVGLGSAETTNPFEREPSLDDTIFTNNTARTDGEVQVIIRDVFAELERDELARLERVEFSRSGADKYPVVHYVNMETGQRDELDLNEETKIRGTTL